MKSFGYARVSTKDQNEGRQVEALGNAGVAPEDMFVDKASGKDFDRQEYTRMLTYLRPGDVVYVQSIDRLGRNYQEIQEQWKALTKDVGVDIVVLDMPLLDTRQNKDLLGTFVSDLVLQVLSFVAENERAKIRERQAQGIALKREKTGRCGGRPRVDKARMEAAVDMYLRYKTVSEIEDVTGVSSSSLYRHLRESGVSRK